MTVTVPKNRLYKRDTSVINTYDVNSVSEEEAATADLPPFLHPAGVFTIYPFPQNSGRI